MHGEEKRAKKRFGYDYSVMCYRKIDARTQKDIISVLRIQVIDISYGGIGIICEKKIEVGDILIFNIAVKDGCRLEFNAEIKWTRKDKFDYRAGLEFVDMNKDRMMFIKDILLQLRTGKHN